MEEDAQEVAKEEVEKEEVAKNKIKEEIGIKNK